MKHKQYVCLVCGFNMIGFHPDNCPFCGAAQRHFISEAPANYGNQVVLSVSRIVHL